MIGCFVNVTATFFDGAVFFLQAVKPRVVKLNAKVIVNPGARCEGCFMLNVVTRCEWNIRCVRRASKKSGLAIASPNYHWGSSPNFICAAKWGRLQAA
jgi:hypothetical protein